MKVLYIAAECKPFSKVGGVADVAGELPLALKKQGIDIEVVTPYYGSVKPRYQGEITQAFAIQFHGNKERVRVEQVDADGVPVNLVSNKTYFEGDYGVPYIYSDIPFLDDALRFSFFSEACLPIIREKKPDIVHVNDWPLCFLLGRMAMEGLPQARALTIHSANYQGNLGIPNIKGWMLEAMLQHPAIGPMFRDPRQDWNSVNPLRLGLELSHCANTVSPTYCRELTMPSDPERYFDGGNGLQETFRALRDKGRLTGILNGIRYQEEPSEKLFSQALLDKAEAKKSLSKRFSDPDGFLIGFAGRAAEQKLGLLADEMGGKSLLEKLLGMPGVNIVIQAQGQEEYEKFARNVSKGRMWYQDFLKTPKRKNYWYSTDMQDAARIFAGSDVFLAPSMFEPCGITQLLAMKNATPPIVRRTGGLADTVKEYPRLDCTGFGFTGENAFDIMVSLIGNVDVAQDLWANKPDEWRQMQRRAYGERFTWAQAAQHYIEMLYEPALRAKQG
jgi:starch synthase